MGSEQIWSAFKTMVTSPTSDSTAVTYCECRRCGTTLDGELADCPYCETADVARYDIERF